MLSPTVKQLMEPKKGSASGAVQILDYAKARELPHHILWKFFIVSSETSLENDKFKNMPKLNFAVKWLIKPKKGGSLRPTLDYAMLEDQNNLVKKLSPVVKQLMEPKKGSASGAVQILDYAKAREPPHHILWKFFIVSSETSLENDKFKTLTKLNSAVKWLIEPKKGVSQTVTLDYAIHNELLKNLNIKK